MAMSDKRPVAYAAASSSGGNAMRSDGRAAASAFDPALLRIEEAPPSPLPRRVLYALLMLLVLVTCALFFGHVDVVVVAEGRLVPRTLLKIVQPADAGVVREILVEEGMAVVAGQPVLRLDARLADADLRAHRHELAQRMLHLRRIDAELGGGDLQRHADDPDDLHARALVQLAANRVAHADRPDRADDGGALPATAPGRVRQRAFRARARARPDRARAGSARPGAHSPCAAREPRAGHAPACTSRLQPSTAAAWRAGRDER